MLQVGVPPGIWEIYFKLHEWALVSKRFYYLQTCRPADDDEYAREDEANHRYCEEYRKPGRLFFKLGEIVLAHLRREDTEGLAKRSTKLYSLYQSSYQSTHLIQTGTLAQS